MYKNFSSENISAQPILYIFDNGPCKMTLSQDFMRMFFHESSSPRPLIITLGSFYFFSKCTTNVVDIDGYIFPEICMTTGVVDTDGKFGTGIKDTCGELLPVAMALVANLQCMSLQLVSLPFVAHLISLYPT
jgi:hypothetical protein